MQVRGRLVMQEFLGEARFQIFTKMAVKNIKYFVSSFKLKLFTSLDRSLKLKIRSIGKT